jgi:hypothetical protein
MKLKKALKIWSKIISSKVTEVGSLCPPIKIPPGEMAQWKLRICDRGDSADWMPFDIRTETGELTIIHVYYINVNPSSDVFSRKLVLTIKGTTATITEWDGDRIISSVHAVIEAKNVRGEIPTTNAVHAPGDVLRTHDYLSNLTGNYL